MVRVTKVTESEVRAQKQQRHAEIQRDVEKARGFCDVIDMLSACGKPIVGHNIVIDLAYILAQFVGPLPSTMEGYKRMIHHTFPIVMDTKYVSYAANPLKGLAYDSSLAGLETMVGSVEFMDCPKIIPHHRHQRYFTSDLSHEAGYDAYITGSIMVRMMAYIVKKQPPIVEPSRETDAKYQSHRQGNTIRPYNGNASKTIPPSPSLHGPLRTWAPSTGTQVPPSQEPSSQTRAQVPSDRAQDPPKKFSYADAVVHRSMSGPQTSATQQQQHHHHQQQQYQKQQQQRDHEPHANVADRSGWDDDYDSEDSYTHPPEPEDFVPMFSFQSPSLQCYQNILYWGRSNHGCINLTNL
ncbi:hypothetical protein BGX34_003836 [Mortierella sp. NVP85]|nr:hypothetical protein BGX34_003836 [Mortierella sp. NVP85]